MITSSKLRSTLPLFLSMARPSARPLRLLARAPFAAPSIAARAGFSTEVEHEEQESEQRETERPRRGPIKFKNKRFEPSFPTPRSFVREERGSRPSSVVLMRRANEYLKSNNLEEALVSLRSLTYFTPD